MADKLKAAFGGRLSFTTDIIVGFPGETEEEFEASMAFISQVGFLKVHVFPYSRRAGTPAADFPDQIPEEVKSRRVKRMQEEAERVRALQIAAMEGQEVDILLETPLSNTVFTGYTLRYVPIVISAGIRYASGQIVRAKLGRYDGQRCQAELL